MSRAITIVLIASPRHTIATIRKGLLDADLAVTGEAATPAEGVEAVVRLRPDVVLLESGGFDRHAELIERIVRFAPASRVLVLAPSDDGTGVIEAIKAGASGYVRAGYDGELAQAVRAAAEGGCPVSSDHAHELCSYVRALGRSEPRATEARAITEALTERELEILRLLPRGESNAEIGQALDLSEHTVRNHVASILTKLRLENRIQAAVKVVRSGLACVAGAEIGQAFAHESDLLAQAVQSVLGG